MHVAVRTGAAFECVHCTSRDFGGAGPVSVIKPVEPIDSASVYWQQSRRTNRLAEQLRPIRVPPYTTGKKKITSFRQTTERKPVDFSRVNNNNRFSLHFPSPQQTITMRTKPEIQEFRPAFSELNISEGFEFDTEMVTNEVNHLNQFLSPVFHTSVEFFTNRSVVFNNKFTLAVKSTLKYPPNVTFFFF